VLVVMVAAWTGPWSSLPAVGWYSAQVQALAPETNTTIPWVGGTAILASWLIVAVLLGLAGKLTTSDIGAIFAKTFHQMWGALLVGVFIFGLAFVFNYSGMASSLAKGFFLPRYVVHRGGAHSRLHRGGALGIQHLDQRHVRQVPVAGRRSARLPASGAKAAEDRLAQRRIRHQLGIAGGNGGIALGQDHVHVRQHGREERPESTDYPRYLLRIAEL
jgi:hypothetical protein